MTCKHDNYQFKGLYSLVGKYHCLDCGAEIEPVEFHRLKGWPHVELDDKKSEKSGLTNQVSGV